MRILAIDPGNMESAYCVINTETYKPEFFAKVDNEYLKSWIRTHDTLFDKVIIEMVASYRDASWRKCFSDLCMDRKICSIS